MFTGLIEEIGTLRSAKRQGEAMVLTIAAAVVNRDVKLGDSIAVNGVCLTVVSWDAASFTVDVMPQTYRYSNLSELAPGSPVNLERAMMAGGRFGGHLVQGHVDGIGRIRSVTPDANAVVFKIAPQDGRLLRTIVPQGSVTLDGISLTVADVDREAGQFSVSIIPHTLRMTALQHKRRGDTVNIENDILGKYVDHLLALRLGGPESGLPAEEPSEAGMRSGTAGSGRRSAGLTEGLLRENGFMV